MAIEILPQIYSSGVFKLKGKLLQYLSEEMWYTCIAIRKIEEIEAVGIDCYQEYYVPIGLDLIRDSIVDIPMYTTTTRSWITLIGSTITVKHHTTDQWVSILDC